MTDRMQRVLSQIRNGDMTVIMHINAAGDKCFTSLLDNTPTLYLTLTCRALMKHNLIQAVPTEYGMVITTTGE